MRRGKLLSPDAAEDRVDNAKVVDPQDLPTHWQQPDQHEIAEERDHNHANAKAERVRRLYGRGLSAPSEAARAGGVSWVPHGVVAARLGAGEEDGKGEEGDQYAGDDDDERVVRCYERVSRADRK